MSKRGNIDPRKHRRGGEAWTTRRIIEDAMKEPQVGFINSTVNTASSIGGAVSPINTFLGLTDTPASYGSANQVPKSNGSSALLWGFIGWTELTGVPSTFPPSTHTHVWADITDAIWLRASNILYPANSSDSVHSYGHLELKIGTSTTVSSSAADQYRIEGGTGRILGRRHSSITSVPDDLAVQEQETFEGNTVAEGTDGGSWQGSQAINADEPTKITATPVFTHNVSTHQTSECWGFWEWIGVEAGGVARNSDLSMGFHLPNFGECNKIKVRIKYKVMFANRFDGANLYICHSAAGETPLTFALTLADNTWKEESTTFDITSWDFSGSGEAIISGVEFLGKTLEEEEVAEQAVWVAYISFEAYAI